MKLFARILCVALFFMWASPPQTWANPEGGVVVGGSATIQAQGKTTTINQNTDKAIINWQTFDIKQDEVTEFKQPNQDSVALNRVVG